MIIVEGWVRMASNDIHALRAAATAMMHATKAAEPGCLEYAFALDLAEPGLLRVIERWADEAALTAHRVRAETVDDQELIRAASHGLAARFRIGHATLQVETWAVAESCRLRPADIV